MIPKSTATQNSDRFDTRIPHPFEIQRRSIQTLSPPPLVVMCSIFGALCAVLRCWPLIA